MGDTIRSFWSKQPKPTGANVKVSMNAKSTLGTLKGVAGAANLPGLVKTYEDIDPATDQDCSARMAALKAIDVAIYAWFPNAAGDSIADKKGAKAMLQLMKKAELAHEQLVDATKDDTNVLPFDTTGLDGTQLAARKKIWTELNDGTSQIELGGTEKFQKRTRAQLAKMLQTGTGAKMLEFLSTKPNGAGPTDRLVLADKLPDDLLSNPRIKQNNPNCSFALDLSDVKDDKNMIGSQATGTEDANEFPTLTSAADLQQAILDRKKGVIYKGRKFTFSKGSGSVVKTVPSRKDSEDSNTTGIGNQEVLTPPFITLGHELGHAINIRSGATGQDHAELMHGLASKAKNGGTMNDEEVSQRWTNSEEFFNISNFENGLRADSGLALRDAHKTRSGLASLDRVNDVRLRHQNLVTKDLVMSRIPMIEALSTQISDNAKKLDDKKAWAKIEQGVIKAENKITDQYVIKFKQDDLQTRFKALVQVYKAKANDLEDDDPLAVEYMAIKDSLDTDIATLTQIGTKAHQDMMDRIRNNRRDLEHK
jgi:hypothetical protein